MVHGIVDEYKDEGSVDTGNCANQIYDSTNHLYYPSGVLGAPEVHYKLNEDAANTTVTDSSGNGHTGTASTNTEDLADTGKVSGGFNITGSNKVDAGTDQVGTGAFTICCWIKVPSVGTWPRIYSNGKTQFVIEMDITGITVTSNDSTWVDSAANAISTDTWHWVCATRSSGGLVNLYVDNSLTGSADQNAGTPQSATTNGIVGNNSAGNRPLAGILDDFRIYNRVLSADERALIYNSGSGTETTTFSPNDMTLISDSFTAESAPDNARIVIREEDVDAVTLNTDLKAYVSRDGGTNWSQATLEDEGDYDSDTRIVAGSVDISGQPSGTNMEYKVTTHNGKSLNVHATALNWD
jgi:hypothetical protein